LGRTDWTLQRIEGLEFYLWVEESLIVDPYCRYAVSRPHGCDMYEWIFTAYQISWLELPAIIE
jgi:hypothetical protein